MWSSVGICILAGWQATSTAWAEMVLHDHTFTPDHILRVSKRNISIACESRLSVVVNGTSPGPPLYISPGRTSWIRVYNDTASDNLSMHWHGLAQRMAPFSDGNVQVSQWPIPPGHFFDYQLSVDRGDSGTYFYHSHIDMQSLSTSGPLIVEDCERLRDVDEERILHFSDYLNNTDANIISGLRAAPFVWSGEVNAVVLNGVGITPGHESSSKSDCSMPIINVKPDTTYRFRCIGSTGISHLVMAFEGHSNLTIIQVDASEYNKPVSVDRLQIGSGQRFDILFRTKTAAQLAEDKKSTYWLQFETRDRPSIYRGYGVLSYASPGAASLRIPQPLPADPPLRLPDATYDWLEYTLAPLYPSENKHPTLAEVTRRVTLDSVQLVSSTTNQTIWRLANLSWTPELAPKPLLVDIYERGDAAIPSFAPTLAYGGWDPATRVIPALVGEVLEIVLQNTGSLVGAGGRLDVHPFHAHGEHVYDIGSGNGAYDAEANERRMVAMGYQAVKRDTIMLYRYETVTAAGIAAGWRALRVRVDRPGMWMIHCHTLQHMIMGMQSVWVAGNAEDIRRIPFEASQGYLQYGSDVYGNETHNPSYYHWPDSSMQC